MTILTEVTQKSYFCLCLLIKGDTYEKKHEMGN